MIKKCSNCGGQIHLAFGVTDFVHNCGENVGVSEVITKEDVVVVGNWEDYDGSGIVSKNQVMMQGLDNEDELTKRGNRKSTHRERSVLTYNDYAEK